MKVAFFSNYLIHHQLPFCLSIRNRLEDEFVFIATEPITQERLDLGYADMNHQYDFVLNAYDSPEDEERAMEIAATFDVVIFGSAPERYFQMRMKKNLLTFRYSERPLKNGRHKILRLKTLRTMTKVHTINMFRRLYLLCASAYAYGDFALAGAYWNRAFRWGYFPDTVIYDETDLFYKKKKNSFLWAGRFLDLKHPDVSIRLAKRMKNAGIDFSMKIIGRGEMENTLKKMISEQNLTDCIQLIGAMSPEEVRKHMEQSSYFLFTSDHHEGWGAVLNESMNSGCVVFASDAIGSVPFLIEDGVNGFSYRNGNEDELYNKVVSCILDSEKTKQIGMQAYKTIVQKWNAEMAAQRFIDVSKGMLNGEKVRFKDGPMSYAKLI